ncbi:unnamed protein product [Miscanthus lutarioriparius]|uniref:rRNA N-glycosidase n=1 Tax=Miscanthus lutarioriparius TaxID=422564 RepID=A0A811RI06_9POAL|nr:unnamed protein product [Miscanthus lutarioriparius]
MDMEGVRSSRAALLFLTLLVLAAAASGGDDAAAAVVEHPLADEPYMLVAFQNKDGEEIRMLADKGTDSLSASGFANRSGHWFYAIREGEGEGKRRRRRLPLPQLSNAEGLWETLGALANTSDPSAADDEEEQGYMLVGMQTSGGDKIRLVAVADQRYVAVTGFAKGFSYCPNWFFRDGERHRLVPTLGGNGGSHAEVVASNLLRALINGGSGMA